MPKKTATCLRRRMRLKATGFSPLSSECRGACFGKNARVASVNAWQKTTIAISQVAQSVQPKSGCDDRQYKPTEPHKRTSPYRLGSSPNASTVTVSTCGKMAADRAPYTISSAANVEKVCACSSVSTDNPAPTRPFALRERAHRFGRRHNPR